MAFITSLPTATLRTLPAAKMGANRPASAPHPARPSRRAFLAAGAALGISRLPVAMAESPSAPSVGIEEVAVGDGKGFTSGMPIKLHYTLALNAFEADGGKVVDSSRTRGKTFSYKFDTGGVIKGWDIGVTGMKVGGKRRLTIPPELGYGARGAGGVIPPNSTLYFDIELVGVGY